MRRLTAHIIARTTVAFACVLGLQACDPDPVPGAKSTEVIRSEAWCDRAGLAAPLRQTVLFIDARAIKPSADAREFAEKNSGLRDLILSVADPNRVQSSGITALRERVSIAVVPPDGSPAQVVFVGCPPGLSAAELAEARKGTSSAAEYFTGDLASKLAKQADAFDEQLIGGLNAAGGRAGGGQASGPITTAPFLAGVRASRALMDNKDLALRLILVADLAQYGAAGGFAEGLAAGRAAGGQLGLAEVHLVAPAGRPVAHRAFLQGWLLGQNAVLSSAGSGRVALATAPPRRLWRFEGQAAYPARGEPVAIRVGDDGAGKLSGAWLTLRGTPDRATPMTGTITCTGTRCSIQSDDGGFAQAWNPSAGGPQRFDSEWPFAGMRSFAFETDGKSLTGKVFDDGVYIGDDTARNSIAITAAAKR